MYCYLAILALVPFHPNIAPRAVSEQDILSRVSSLQIGKSPLVAASYLVQGLPIVMGAFCYDTKKLAEWETYLRQHRDPAQISASSGSAGIWTLADKLFLVKQGAVILLTKRELTAFYNELKPLPGISGVSQREKVLIDVALIYASSLLNRRKDSHHFMGELKTLAPELVKNVSDVRTRLSRAAKLEPNTHLPEIWR